MKKILIAITLVSLLTACETNEEIVQRHGQKCSSYGFQYNTVAHAQCVQSEVAQENAAIREKLKSRPMPPPPPINMPTVCTPLFGGGVSCW